MVVKAFEIRDKATFIPVVAIKMMVGGEFLDFTGTQSGEESERYLLRRSGYADENLNVILCKMNASGTDRNATYDPWAWGNRTMQVAHRHIEQNWASLNSGDVIDVEFILNETQKPKKSERYDTQ